MDHLSFLNVMIVMPRINLSGGTPYHDQLYPCVGLLQQIWETQQKLRRQTFTSLKKLYSRVCSRDLRGKARAFVILFVSLSELTNDTLQPLDSISTSGNEIKGKIVSFHVLVLGRAQVGQLFFAVSGLICAANRIKYRRS
jgi:hypothetical protein